MSLIRHIDAATLRLISFVTTSERTKESLHQFIKFAIIGVFNTFVDFAIYYTLTRHTAFFDVATSMKYVANAISFIIATTFSFFANRWWTFERKDKATIGEAARFYSTTLSGLVLNIILLAVLIRVFSIHDLIAKVFATIVTVFWNFLFKKFWVFNPNQVQPTSK
ncbi:GtrA family protein [Candidatus Parcubacteria bacterium]|nr:GtrA family protein [Candidatus Parcubacteria bacterium]